MHSVITKTLGGLSPQYYFRQFFFGLIFPAFTTFMLSRSTHPFPLVMIGLLVFVNK